MDNFNNKYSTIWKATQSAWDTSSKQQSIGGFKQPSAFNNSFSFKQPDSGFKQLDSGFKQPDSVFKQPDSVFKQPDSFSFKQPDSGFKQPDSFSFKQPSFGLSKLSLNLPRNKIESLILMVCLDQNNSYEKIRYMLDNLFNQAIKF